VNEFEFTFFKRPYFVGFFETPRNCFKYRHNSVGRWM
jgi:hypothetical protein